VYINIGGSPKDFEKSKSQRCTIIGFGEHGNNIRNNFLGYMATVNVRHGETACIGYTG